MTYSEPTWSPVDVVSCATIAEVKEAACAALPALGKCFAPTSVACCLCLEWVLPCPHDSHQPLDSNHRCLTFLACICPPDPIGSAEAVETGADLFVYHVDDLERLTWLYENARLGRSLDPYFDASRLCMEGIVDGSHVVVSATPFRGMRMDRGSTSDAPDKPPMPARKKVEAHLLLRYGWETCLTKKNTE